MHEKKIYFSGFSFFFLFFARNIYIFYLWNQLKFNFQGIKMFSGMKLADLFIQAHIFSWMKTLKLIEFLFLGNKNVILETEWILVFWNFSFFFRRNYFFGFLFHIWNQLKSCFQENRCFECFKLQQISYQNKEVTVMWHHLPTQNRCILCLVCTEKLKFSCQNFFSHLVSNMPKKKYKM